MNFTVGIFCLIFSALLGFLLSKKYTKRKTFYEDFYFFTTELKNQVSFGMRTIEELIKNNMKASDFYRLLSDYYKEGELGDRFNYLTREDWAVLSDYLKTIDKSDKKTLLNYLDTTSNELLKKKNEAIADEAKYKSLYIKLGILFGITLMIIFL